MRNCLVLFLLLCVFVPASLSIPWPLGDGVTGWESIFPITRTFGNFDENAFWVLVNSTFSEYSFHNAIDISYEDAGTENIRAVETGVFEDCRITFPGSNEWFAHIFPAGSSYGWHYGHVNGTDGSPLILSQVIPGISSATYGDILGTMAAIPDRHLHFFRTDQLLFQNGIPGIGNPLDYLEPSPTPKYGYTWEIVTSTPSLIFLPQRDAIYGSDSWTSFYNPPTPGGGVDPSAVLGDTLNRNMLFGSVDVMHGVFVRGNPQGSSVDCSGIPQSIQWTLNQIKPTGADTMFTKYVVNFVGSIGEAPGHWQEFRRFYFPFFAYQLGFLGAGSSAPFICLTNAGDASGYDGINNIEENNWQTNQHNSGSGTAQASELARFKDGLYQIQVTSYAYDNSSHQVSESVTLDNFPPNVVEAIVYRKGPESDVSSELPPFLGCWVWAIEEEPILLRNLFSQNYSDSYLSANEEDRLGVVLVFSEQMEEMPELWISGEWPGGSWDSRSGGTGAEFNACEWDPNLPSPSPGSTHLLQCFETGSGITGYHGDLNLNITGGEDLCGNSLDADPGTVAVPRNAQGFGSGYEQGVDGSYPWTNNLPHYARQSDYVVAGTYGIEVELDEVMAQYTLIGDCPYWHGFWMGSVGVSILPSQFRV